MTGDVVDFDKFQEKRERQLSKEVKMLCGEIKGYLQKYFKTFYDFGEVWAIDAFYIRPVRDWM